MKKERKSCGKYLVFHLLQKTFIAETNMFLILICSFKILKKTSRTFKLKDIYS